MKNFLVKIKAWQLCAVMFGSVYVLPMLLLSCRVGNHLLSSYSWMIFLVIYVGYLWILGFTLSKEISLTTGFWFWLFNIALAYVLIYNLFFLTMMSSGFYHMNRIVTGSEFFKSIMPFHTAAMVCMLYGLIYDARVFVSKQRKKAVKLDDYIGAFFLLWFLPIGIFWIQPRVVDLLANKEGDSNNKVSEDVK